MASPRQPKGVYLGNSGDITPNGVLHFLDPDTDIPKTVYADRDLTSLAANPISLGSDGRTPYQIFYAKNSVYKVMQYELIDDSIVAPEFPDDYALVTSWIDDNTIETTSAASGEVFQVDTINDLAFNVDPNEHTLVEVIGYFNRNDQIDSRQYYWNPVSTTPSDGGSCVSSALVGTGRWLLKTASPVIDVRWFGAIGNSGVDCNSAIINAIAFAQSNPTIRTKPSSVFFPSGVYQVVSGTISTNAEVIFDERCEFLNRLNGDFRIDIQGAYDIKKTSKIQANNSVGTCRLQFSNTTYGQRYDVAIPYSIFNSVDEAFANSGLNPILINEEVDLEATANYNAKSVKFVLGGLLNINNNFKITFSKVVTDNDRVQRFFYLYNGTAKLGFDSSVALYSGWFGGLNDVLKFSTFTDCTLYVNDDEGMQPSYSINLSALKEVISQGGKFELQDGCTITMPSRLTGRLFTFANYNANVVFSSDAYRYYNSQYFWIEDGQDVLGFIKNCSQLGLACVFNNEVVTQFVNLSLLPNDVILENFKMTDNTIQSNQNLVLKNSQINASINFSSCDLTMRNSILVTPIGNEQINAVNATDSTFSGGGFILVESSSFNNCDILSNLTATKVDIVNCRIGELVLITVQTYDDLWDFNITDCIFNGAFIAPSGTGLAKRAYILRNDFRYPSIFTTELYEPIMTALWVVTPETETKFGIANCVVGYNIQVKDNTPEFISNPQQALPISGTLVRQTKFKIRSDSTTNPSIRIGSGTVIAALTPILDDKFFCAHIMGTAISSNSSVSWNRVFNEITSSIFELSGQFGTLTDTYGYAAEIDLYGSKDRL